MKPYARLLQRIADAMAFANTGNFREFEKPPVKRDRRLAPTNRSTSRRYGAATRRTSRTAPTVFTLLFNEATPR